MLMESEMAGSLKIYSDLEHEAQEERRMLEADWIADTQLQLSQLSYLDADDDQLLADQDQPPLSPLSPSDNQSHEAELSDNNSPQEAEGSQAQPLEVSSDSEPLDSEPRRSGRVKKPSVVMESQQWQIEHGLIPAPGAKGKARALNAKKKKNVETSQLENEFRFSE
jgi:hypothetical protein